MSTVVVMIWGERGTSSLFLRGPSLFFSSFPVQVMTNYWYTKVQPTTRERDDKHHGLSKIQPSVEEV